MKKLALALFTLTACTIGDKANKAEIMVKAQAPTANCKSARVGNTDVSICEIAGKDKILSFVAAYGDKGFKVYPLDDQPPAVNNAGQGEGSRAQTPPDAAPAPDAK